VETVRRVDLEDGAGSCGNANLSLRNSIDGEGRWIALRRRPVHLWGNVDQEGSNRGRGGASGGNNGRGANASHTLFGSMATVSIALTARRAHNGNACVIESTLKAVSRCVPKDTRSWETSASAETGSATCICGRAGKTHVITVSLAGATTDTSSSGTGVRAVDIGSSTVGFGHLQVIGTAGQRCASGDTDVKGSRVIEGSASCHARSGGLVLSI
jgi:hypothetical protein